MARKISKEVECKADEEESNKKKDRERAIKEKWFQTEYAQKRNSLRDISDQLARDHAESDQIKKEEERLLAVRAQVWLNLEELHQCDMGLRALLGQKHSLLTCLKERVTVSAEQVQQVQAEEESLVEIEMETEEIETEMDDTIVEQGELPKANSKSEE